MCGIAGVFGAPDLDTVRVMLGALRHRGPDDGHAVAGKDFVLGARRLSIVDLAGGRQPLANEDETVWAAQNGELYNYPEERPRLLARGHRLRTSCDTELLPHLYEEVGTDLPARLDGMFAVCLWDEHARQGLLARDRTGKKPLYYLERDGSLYFASEIKALLHVPGFRPRLDLTALHHYLGLKHVPQPRTIFEGVRALPPAHVLVWRAGRPVELRRYWAPDFTGHPRLAACPEEELAERLLELLRRGVRRRLMADVPVGFFLSGGIDSSLTTALAAELSPGRVKTFTLTYADGASTGGKDLDRHWARWVAERYGTEHYEERIAVEDFPGRLRDILRCFDEPFAGVVSTYFLAQLIGRHVKVAVSGDGADELFGSYLSHRLAFPLDQLPAYRLGGDASLLRPFEGQVGYLAGLYEPEAWAWRSKLLVFGEDERRALYAPDVADVVREVSTAEYWRAAFDRTTAADPLNRVLEAEFLTIFPDQVLAFVDRLSMAHSLEVRTAFLDTQVIEFVAGLPGRLKVRDGQTKYLLKRAALRYFPPEMVHRPKEGFVMPVARWLADGLHGYVGEVLSPERLGRHGIFDAGRIQELVERTYAGPCDHRQMNKVYALLVFQEWYDLYLASSAWRQQGTAPTLSLALSASRARRAG
jgi:asparagine synthase (glutamine-hydrolysing)